MIEIKKRINVFVEPHMKLKDFISVQFRTVRNLTAQKEVWTSITSLSIQRYIYHYQMFKLPNWKNMSLKNQEKDLWKTRKIDNATNDYFMNIFKENKSSRKKENHSFFFSNP